MSKSPVSPWRVLGYWLLYSVTGILLVLAATSGGADISEDSSSPMRTASKIVGGGSGALLIVSTLGWWIVNQAVQDEGPALVMAIVASAGAVVATIAAWVMIAKDLRKRGSR